MARRGERDVLLCGLHRRNRRLERNRRVAVLNLERRFWVGRLTRVTEHINGLKNHLPSFCETSLSQIGLLLPEGNPRSETVVVEREKRRD